MERLDLLVPLVLVTHCLLELLVQMAASPVIIV
jgi:hypothetical protein